MTKEEYRKASHFRDATKMVAAPGSLSGLFDSAPLFRVSFPWPVELPARDWRPVSWRVVAELCFGFFVDYAKGGGKSPPP